MRAAIGLFACVALVACSGTDGGTPAGSGSGGGGSVTGDACNLDLNAVPTPETPISFKDDVLPILGLGCNGGSCHADTSQGHMADFILGPACQFDDSAAGGPWGCRFPETRDDSNPTSTIAPLTQADIDLAYTNLLTNATTVTGSTVKRVDPGNPKGSFLLDKLSDKQNSLGYECTNQDPGHSTAGKCGSSMPLSSDPLCRQSPTKGTGARKYIAIAQWIQAGAPKN